MDPSSSSSSNKRKRDLDCYDEPRYKRPKYDVFVNYAPEDIGNSFASHLKGALGREGFTICDHNMLPKGEDKSSQLLKAIEESEIYLVVFSTKYAFSKECLDEFVLIMESYLKFKKRKVFPIFFDVEPSHVRNQQGSFLEAFQGHEKNVDAERVQIWRQSLKEAGDKSGLNLKDWRDENQLIREIIKDASKMKNPQQLCDVEHPVGIESRSQDIISALRLSDQAPSIVAVLGISGSGKTTIAKAVHDRIAADFDVSCFIQDINSYVYRGSNWKVDLQRDVISCLTGNDKFIASHNDGAAKIRKLISGQKLFLVLDDVYTFEQLQALSIPSASFHCESRIIVTTRNVQSLSNLQHTSYNIELLDTSESFELFTRLIGQGDPMDKKFVDAIVRCAGGIPLVLEVWSRHFTDYDRNLWPSMLETLKRIPHEDIQKKLRISYDSLPKRAQNLFLDIACFFDGERKDLTVKVLKDEDFFPDVEIQIENLVHKFLVKYGEYKVLLHDVIRKMGQEVVRQENEDEPGKRTRLMGYRDVVHVLEDCSGTDSVRSIKLDYSDPLKEGATVQLEAFKKMSNLRFIKLEDSKLQWSSSSKDDMSACFSFKHLKYLQWGWFPCKCLDNIDMGNMVVIKLWNSKLERLWEGVKNFKKLKILDVSFSSSLIKTGNFIGLENLEELRLSHCENLEELDRSIGYLQKLVSLDLRECSQLKSLPWEIGSLISLKYFYLSYNISSSSLPNSQCSNLKSIPDLPLNIEYVNADDCRNLVNLPSNCSQLQFLTELWLNDCCKLGSEGFTQVTRLRRLQKLGMRNCNISQVSSGIGNLVSLRFLELSENTFSSLPESFSNLSKLETLDINNCSQLQLLPPLPSKLEYIGAVECCSLDVMPFDSMQNAYIFPSNVFKLSNLSICIDLSMEELPEWCTSRDSGNNVLSFVASIQFDHSKICGLILCVTTFNNGGYWEIVYPAIYNKTKGTSHKPRNDRSIRGSMMVMFCPLNDTTLLVEAGDTVEVEFDDRYPFESFGLCLVYEDEVVDSGLVLKDVREPLFPTSEMSAGIIQLSSDDDVHFSDDGLIIQDVTNPTLPAFPSPESEIMSGIITQLNDIEVCSSIQDVEYPCYDYFNAVPEFQMYWEGNW